MDTVIPKIIFPELFIGLVAPVGANINSSILAFRKYFEANTYLVEEIMVTDIFPVMGKYVKPKIQLSTASEFDRYSTYIKYGDQLHVEIFHGKDKVYSGDMPYSQTFGAVDKGKPLAYLNSLLQLSFALNQDDFAKTYSVTSGNDWRVEVHPVP